MIADLEALTLTCSDEEAKTHIREALKCYEAGAYRAAIVAAYVAMCFDLINKLKILAADGDDHAEFLTSNLEQLQQNADRGDPQAFVGLLKFERELLEQFRDKFEFFGINEFEELDRVRSDRNRCAHPSFVKNSGAFHPSAELARLHIRNVLSFVLAQEPRQGKAALGGLESVVLSQYFPEEQEAVNRRIRATELAKGRDSLVKAFVDQLIFGLCDEQSPYHYSINAIRALEAVAEIRRDIAVRRSALNLNKIMKKIDGTDLRIVGAATLRIPDVAELMSESSREILKGWLSVESGTNVANVVNRAINVSWFKDDAITLVDKLEAQSYPIEPKNLHPVVVTHAAKLYAASKSWDEANRVAEGCVFSLVSQFSESDICLIIDAASDGTADLQGSHSFRKFIARLVEVSPLGVEKIKSLIIERSLDFYLPDESATHLKDAE